MSNDLTTEGRTPGLSYNLMAPAYNRAAVDALDRARSGMVNGAGGKLEWNMPISDTDRKTLMGRAVVLTDELNKHNPRMKALYIGDMLGCYDQSTKDAREMAGVIKKYVDELHDVPTWAVCLTCAAIKNGLAPGISLAFKPTTIQVRVAARQKMEPALVESRNILAALEAKKWKEVIDLDPETRAAVGIKMQAFAKSFGGKVRDEDDRRNAAQIARVRQERAEANETAILREYQRLGIDPIRRRDGVLITPALLAALGRLPKVKSGPRAKGQARA